MISRNVLLGFGSILLLLLSIFAPLLSASESPPSQGMIVKKIQFVGLKKVISLVKGKPFSRHLLNQSIQQIKNLGFFHDVTGSFKKSESGTFVQFEVKEFGTLFPVFRFGGVKGNQWVDLGINDRNWLGNAFRLDAFYRYNKRHSGAVSLTMPRLIGRKWGLIFNSGLFHEQEKAFTETGELEYDIRRVQLLAGLIYHLTSKLQLSFSVGYFGETQTPLGGESVKENENNQRYDKILTKLELYYDHVDYLGIYQRGIKNHLIVETVKTDGVADRFNKILNISTAFLHFSQSNLAFRIRTGFASNIDSPFVPFVLDSFLNVRGSGNKLAGGTAELTINAEFRHLIFRTGSIAVQGVLFTDCSAWRPPGGSLSDMFVGRNVYYFSGIGCRIHIPSLGNIIFRADYGVNLKDRDQQGVVFGIGQYF